MLLTLAALAVVHVFEGPAVALPLNEPDPLSMQHVNNTICPNRTHIHPWFGTGPWIAQTETNDTDVFDGSIMPKPLSSISIASTVLASVSTSFATPTSTATSVAILSAMTNNETLQAAVQQPGGIETPNPAINVATSASVGAAGETVSASRTTNDCEDVSTPCAGDITYWDGGSGACGWSVDTNTMRQIALPYEFMGPKSNGNPYCGRSLIIRNPTTGQEVSATVGDKCMGCVGRSIDLTYDLFRAVDEGCDGRCFGYQWWFVD